MYSIYTSKTGHQQHTGKEGILLTKVTAWLKSFQALINDQVNKIAIDEQIRKNYKPQSASSKPAIVPINGPMLVPEFRENELNKYPYERDVL